MNKSYFDSILESVEAKTKMLAILVDPEKFNVAEAELFLEKIPKETTHIFVGGSTVHYDETEITVSSLKEKTELPIFLFPGDYSHITDLADVLLFLSLLSGRNPEYLVGQQIQAVPKLKKSSLEIIPTGYILIDGGAVSSVSKVTQTQPLLQENIENIVHTALAGQYMGAKLIYLEAGSGALFPVNSHVISEVKKEITIPLIVGGGIRTEEQIEMAYEAGADMLVMGTAFEQMGKKVLDK